MRTAVQAIQDSANDITFSIGFILACGFAIVLFSQALHRISLDQIVDFAAEVFTNTLGL